MNVYSVQCTAHEYYITCRVPNIRNSDPKLKFHSNDVVRLIVGWWFDQCEPIVQHYGLMNEAWILRQNRLLLLLLIINIISARSASHKIEYNIWYDTKYTKNCLLSKLNFSRCYIQIIIVANWIEHGRDIHTYIAFCFLF